MCACAIRWRCSAKPIIIFSGISIIITSTTERAMHREDHTHTGQPLLYTIHTQCYTDRVGTLANDNCALERPRPSYEKRRRWRGDVRVSIIVDSLKLTLVCTINNNNADSPMLDAHLCTSRQRASCDEPVCASASARLVPVVVADSAIRRCGVSGNGKTATALRVPTFATDAHARAQQRQFILYSYSI